eukprot:3978182-Pyramimonas_sp.AAC.1
MHWLDQTNQRTCVGTWGRGLVYMCFTSVVYYTRACHIGTQKLCHTVADSCRSAAAARQCTASPNAQLFDCHHRVLGIVVFGQFTPTPPSGTEP